MSYLSHNLWFLVIAAICIACIPLALSDPNAWVVEKVIFCVVVFTVILGPVLLIPFFYWLMPSQKGK